MCRVNDFGTVWGLWAVLRDGLNERCDTTLMSPKDLLQRSIYLLTTVQLFVTLSPPELLVLVCTKI